MGAPRWPTRRTLLVDGLVAVFAAVTTIVGSTKASEWEIEASRSVDWLTYLLLAVAAAPLVLRRTWPRAVLAVAVAASGVYIALGYPYGPVFQAMAFAMYTVAVRLPIRRSLAAAGIGTVVLLGGHLIRNPTFAPLGEAPQMIAGIVGWLVLPTTVGTVVALRRESAARDREEAQNRRVFDERLAVAREVHDVVGHGLAVINMRAAIALHLLERRPQEAAAALEAIKQTSKDALEELRATLAVFRQPGNLPTRPVAGGAAPPDGAAEPSAGDPGGVDGLGGLGGLGGVDGSVTTADTAAPVGASPSGRRRGARGQAGSSGSDGLSGERGEAAPRRPLPGLAQLDALVGTMADSGLDVRVEVGGERRRLSAAVDLAAYRIVQESLTNVIRHASATVACVQVDYEPHELTVEVVDDGSARPGAVPAPAALGVGADAGGGRSGPRAAPRGDAGSATATRVPGHGLAGMRERAESVGGSFDAGPRPEGGFRVHARLPFGGGAA